MINNILTCLFGKPAPKTPRQLGAITATRRDRALASTAVYSGNLRALKHLIEHRRIDVNSHNYRGNNPLIHFAIDADQPAILDYLIAMKADVNAQDSFGNTPLHVVVTKLSNDLDSRFIQTLLKSGATIWIRNHKNKTPLDVAIQHKRAPIVKGLERALMNDTRHALLGTVPSCPHVVADLVTRFCYQPDNPS